MTHKSWLDVQNPWTARAVRLTRVSALAAGACLLASACASGGKHPGNDQDVHPVALRSTTT